MADTDLTGVELRIPGVNARTNYTKQAAIRFDGKEHAPSMAVGKHRLFTIPAGEVLTSLKVLSLNDAVSSASGTVKFGLLFEGEMSPEYINATPLAKTVFAKGKTINLPVGSVETYDGVTAYNADKSADVVLEIATGAYTDLNLLMWIETIPALDFITRG